MLKDLQELDFECRVLQGFKLNRKGRIKVVKFSLGHFVKHVVGTNGLVKI